MIHVLAWTLCALGWFVAFSLIRRNEMLRRELVLALLRIAPRESLPILARDLAELSGRVLRPGTIYVTLDELEQEGLVASDPLLFDPYHRRVYAATCRVAELHHNPHPQIGGNVSTEDDKKPFNLRDVWRDRAARDPDWAADQLYKGFQEDIRLQEEIMRLREGIIEKGDAPLIDQLQRWVLEHYRVEINLSHNRQHSNEPWFRVRLYDALGRAPAWTTGSSYELREAIRWAMEGAKTLEERDPDAADVARAQGRKLEGT